MKLEDGLDVCAGEAWPLGVTKTARGINFAVSVDKREPFVLKVWAGGCCHEVPMNMFHAVGDIYAVCVKNLKVRYFEYVYQCGNMMIGDVRAQGVAGAGTWGEPRPDKRFCFWNRKFDWGDERRPKLEFHELVMYKLHVRGFTIMPSSKVRGRGTFAGVAAKADYLKQLGVNCVELMPAVEFDEMMPENDRLYVIPSKTPEKYKMDYWGYHDAFYFAPKAAYASGNCPPDEFKQMVKTLHEAGIEVVMEFSFSSKVNKNLIIDCLRYWTTEYHVDGFHVSSGTVPMQLLTTDPVLSEVKIFSEGFDTASVYGQRVPEYKHLAAYHDGYAICCRRFLKGDEDMVSAFTKLVRENDYQQSFVRYLSNHNGFRLFDAVSYDVKHNEANGEDNKDGTDYNYSWNCGAEGVTKRRRVMELRKRQLKNAWIFAIFNQGIPLIYAGDEFGHTQNGNNNAYCQDNEISWLDWRRLRKNKALYDFVKSVLTFRKCHPVMHCEKPLRMMDYLGCGYPDFSVHGQQPWKPDMSPASRYIGHMYCGKYAHFDGTEDDFIYIAYNMHWEKTKIYLPALPKMLEWTCVIDTSSPEVAATSVSGYEVGARTIAVFISRPASETVTACEEVAEVMTACEEAPEEDTQ